MIGSVDSHPVQLLYDIGQKCRSVAKGLPQRIDISRDWTGIGFRVGEYNLVAPLGQVNEILHSPSLTVVPGAQPWVRGVANVRGVLLPIMDLRGYLGTPAPSTASMNSRVLMIKNEELITGLLVDEVLGLKHFKEEEKISAVTNFDESLRKFIRGAFSQDGVETLVFSMEALALDPNFYQVAV